MPKSSRGAPFGVGVEYALHCLLHLVDLPAGQNLVLRDLAAFQGISETYLAKVFARLKKAGIIRSAPGVKGGYELARSPDAITFWDVTSAVEGSSPLFQCHNVRAKCILDQGGEVPSFVTTGVCTIHAVMIEAEAHLRRHLESKTLAWLHGNVSKVLPEHRKAATSKWFAETMQR